MRLCRFRQSGMIRCGIYDHGRVLPIDDLAAMAGEKYVADLLHGGNLERILPVGSPAWFSVAGLIADAQQRAPQLYTGWLQREEFTLLPPIAHPPKLLLLAGNYAKHIEEQGGIAHHRESTFPYVFMKPPTTTLVGDEADVEIPPQSPQHIDHEIELAVVIGQRTRNIAIENALDYVAGYTVINDLSDRRFRLNPHREQRPRDEFFDWLHGKWHDGFCPCGPCLVTADEIADPQALKLELTVDGDLRQSASTGDQIFSVAEVIAYLSSWMTLEPGDIISTGTPSGVGSASGEYLKAGQTVVASIESIGRLTTHMI